MEGLSSEGGSKSNTRDKILREKYKIVGKYAMGYSRHCRANVVKDRVTQKYYCCRSYHVKNFRIAANVVNILQQLQAVSSVSKLHDAVKDEDYVHLILNLCTSGTVIDEVIRLYNKRGVLYEGDIASILKAMLVTTRQLHSHRITHGDLQPFHFGYIRNESVPAHGNANTHNTSGQRTLTLVDFDYCRSFEKDNTSVEVVGMPTFWAPEIGRRYPHGTRIDVWGIGVTMCVLLTGNHPRTQSPSIFGASKKEQYRLFKSIPYDVDLEAPQFANMSKGAKHLLTCLLKEDSSKRISIHQALQHPWIMQANVNKHPVPPPVVARLTVIKQQYMHSQIEDSSEPDDEIAQLVPNVKTNILDNLLCDDSEEEDSEHKEDPYTRAFEDRFMQDGQVEKKEEGSKDVNICQFQ